ncbi:MAG: zinc ribbon domain-containing protein [Phycisphaerae bacterium]|nr:zinc ribbon domain-containing protein [Phycisphaerae bacterium]
MDSRRLILRLTLACLGVTALCALSLVVMPWGGATSRLTFTALFATITAGGCIPFGLWATHPEKRWGGLAGIAIMALALCLAILAIWIDYLSPGTNAMPTLSFLVYLASASPFVVVGARELVRHRAAGVTAVAGGLVAMLLLAIQAYGYGGIDAFDRSTFPIGPIAYTVLLWGGGAALGLVPRRRATGWQRHWPLVGTSLATIAAIIAVLWCIYLWPARGAYGPAHVYVRLAVLLGAAGYAIGIANVAFVPRLAGFGVLAQWAVAGSAACAAITLALMTEVDEDAWTMPFVASLIMLLASGLAVAALVRWAAVPEFSTGSEALREVTIICPRCRRSHAHPLGASACPTCGLRFELKVEEPRCAGCGQLFAGAATERCPECGLAVTALAASQT